MPRRHTWATSIASMSVPHSSHVPGGIVCQWNANGCSIASIRSRQRRCQSAPNCSGGRSWMPATRNPQSTSPTSAPRQPCGQAEPVYSLSIA